MCWGVLNVASPPHSLPVGGGGAGRGARAAGPVAGPRDWAPFLRSPFKGGHGEGLYALTRDSCI
jgi:hypothetical protein